MIIVKRKVTINNIYRLTIDIFDLILKLWYTNILIQNFLKIIVYKESLVWDRHCCQVALRYSLVFIMKYCPQLDIIIVF